MLVKCRLCGTKVDRNEAFKVVVGGKNNYYCNEAEYQKVLHEREVKIIHMSALIRYLDIKF